MGALFTELHVSYGYIGASFSGRMPCVDIADAIVQTARETLENAIRKVNTTAAWGAEVVYGDTDSMFVLCKGVTRHRAFEIGHEIAAAVTAANPAPIKLQFEKVYHPSVLVTKKRYVGWKYEGSADAEPVFDAKGIETVRRDTCPLVAKLMRKSLESLFKTRDLSLVKYYLQKQFQKIFEDRLPLSDFTFRKEVRLGTYACIPRFSGPHYC